MLKFPRQLSSEYFEFASTDSLTEFSDKLQDLASRSRAFSLSPNLFIKLLPGNEFTVTVKVGKGPFNNALFGFGTTAILRGYYFKSNLNDTQVNILVSSHYLFSVLFLLLPILFIVMLFINIRVWPKFSEFYPVMFIMMIAAPAASLFASEISKKRLLKRFVKYFELTKIV